MDYYAQTLVGLLERTLQHCGDSPALHTADPQGEWQTLSWDQVAQRVFRLADRLQQAGLAPGDRVAHLAENRLEWIITDLALHVARCVHVPLHATLSGPQIIHQIAHSEARLAIIAGPDLLGRCLDQLNQTQVEQIVLYDECPNFESGAPRAMLSDWLAEGEETAGRALFDTALTTTQPDELATILYTSGTTGEPKGVMLSQRNLATNTIATSEAVEFRSDSLRLNFLPLSHIYARTCDLYSWVERGSELALARARETVLEDCAAIHPTILNGVPYFYEKVRSGLVAAGVADAPGALQATFGGAIEVCFCGGAAVSSELAQWYHERGVSLLPGYGLTESSPVISATAPGDFRSGTVGKLIPDVEVKIAPDGEILTRGPHVMLGYWKNDTATAETMDGEWLKTGDLGSLDDAQHLRILGRKKEIIVLATGKNVAPAGVEGCLLTSPLIEQAFVVGDDRKYLAALIVPNYTALASRLAEANQNDSQSDAPRKTSLQARQPEGVPSSKTSLQARLPQEEAALRNHPATHSLYEAEIAACLEDAAHEEHVKQFALLERPFLIEQGELTAKLSLRREIIAANFAETIDRLYAISATT